MNFHPNNASIIYPSRTLEITEFHEYFHSWDMASILENLPDLVTLNLYRTGFLCFICDKCDPIDASFSHSKLRRFFAPNSLTASQLVKMLTICPNINELILDDIDIDEEAIDVLDNFQLFDQSEPFFGRHLTKLKTRALQCYRNDRFSQIVGLLFSQVKTFKVGLRGHFQDAAAASQALLILMQNCPRLKRLLVWNELSEELEDELMQYGWHTPHDPPPRLTLPSDFKPGPRLKRLEIRSAHPFASHYIEYLYSNEANDCEK